MTERLTTRICTCTDNEGCALCRGMDDPATIAAADDAMARLLGGN